MPYTYNGWKNKPTWLVNVWLGDYLQESLQESDIRDVYDASKYLKSMVEDMTQGDTATVEGGFVTDLLTYVMAEIDYYELALVYIRDMEEQESE